jgi:Glyoxalase/Bleomycin resistance protein/Dioxygenase superfamily
MRSFRPALILLLLLGALTPTQSAHSAVSAVDSIGITVSDMDRSVAFYRDVLEFRRALRAPLRSIRRPPAHGSNATGSRVD